MSANDYIETVELELIRPGPSHGQLLSPLTPYLALCGDESPVTLNIDFEHWRLLNRLERLRYLTRDGTGMTAVPNSSRESELEQLGRDVGEILTAIPTLVRELGRAAGRGSGLVHLRLLISGSELSLLPYELVVAPVGYPVAGLPLLLQAQTPIVITRQARRGQYELPLRWNRKPRILFVSAAPGGMHVPAREHVHALRGVLEPWIKWDDDPKKRLAAVKEHLNVLTDASIEAIKKESAQGDYTHVHILAHGGSYLESGQTRYGLVLCEKNDPTKARVVDGQTVAAALHTKLAEARGYSGPSVVSLATCDAGNIGSVIAPGSSIAHDLHMRNVPWVFASQFPLTKRGSVGFVQRLYDGLLWGEDPRRLLAHLRQSLHVERRRDHDWASLVAYESTPVDLDEEVQMFRSKQYQRAVDRDRARADYFQGKAEKADDVENAATYKKECDAALKSARHLIARWRAQLPKGDDPVARTTRAECYGVQGATEKKLAEHYHEAGRKQEEEKALRSSLAAYRDALRTAPYNHWAVTQYLSLTAVLNRGVDRGRWASAWVVAYSAIETETGLDRAWAYGTLAELELLQLYYWPQLKGEAEVVKDIKKYCDRIVELVGWDGFAVFSTRRQFQRYANWWWKENPGGQVAAKAVERLTQAID